MKRRFALILVCSLFPLLFGCEKRAEIPPAEESPAAEALCSALVPAENADTITRLELNGEHSAAELLAALPRMPALTSVRWSPCPLSMEERVSFRKQCPNISFDWDLKLGSTVFSSMDEEIDIHAEKKDIPSLLSLLPLMGAKSIDLSGWEITAEDAAALREVRGDIDYLYPVELYGLTFSSADNEIDFGELEIDDTEELEKALVLFNHLEKVLMLRTTLDNAAMDALNTRHEGTQFVWLVQVMTLAVRSDTTYFTIYNPYELRYTRTNMLEVLNSDYIRTARAKGLSERKVVYHHAFRNTLIPLVTMVGGSLPGLFSGALITETLFSIPGIGYASYHAMVGGDIPFSMFYLTFLAVLTLLGNLISDILYAVVDPRVRIA